MESKTEHAPLAQVMERNIASLIERRKSEQAQRTPQEQVADAVTRFAGTMGFVWVHLAVIPAWVLVNLPGGPGPRFDPELVILAALASVEALLISALVLIKQNRMSAQEEQRAELNLQISLLAEHEITKVVELVQAMAERMGLEQAHNPELHELKKEVAPEKVLDHIERTQQADPEA